MILLSLIKNSRVYNVGPKDLVKIDLQSKLKD